MFPFPKMPQWVCIFALITFSSNSSIAGDLTDADKEVIRWFDQLGFPDLSQAKFVRVSMEWPRVGDEPPDCKSFVGFLLSEEPERFTVLTLDLVRSTLLRHSDEAFHYERASFAPADLASESAVEQGRSSDVKLDEDYWVDEAGRTGRRTRLFTLARGCAAHSLERTAHQIIAASASVLDLQTETPVDVRDL